MGENWQKSFEATSYLFFYRNSEEAIALVRHGFFEWLLNQRTQPYLRLINKLITLHEEQQYERKEKVIEALLNLL